MKKYRIAFNALGMKKNSGGIEAYIYGVIKSILDIDTENQYYIFAGKSTADVFDSLKKYKNLKIIVYPINTNNSTIRVITEHTLMALGIICQRINLVHHMIQYMPRFCPTKSVTTLHDLSGFYFYENLPHTKVMTKYYNYLKRNVKYTLSHTKKIILVSDFTRSEIHKYYRNIDDSLLVTTGMAPDPRKDRTTSNEHVLEGKQIIRPYILSVSIIRPHKNYPFLIRTFNLLKRKFKIPHQLVICGGMGLEMHGLEKNDFLEEINNSPYKKDIKYLGYTSNEDLAALFKNADIYATATKYEGFGTPIIEAMMYNIPIACSQAASLPEVGGEGCAYFNPDDENNAAEVIYKVLSDNTQKEYMLSKQKERLAHYSWNNIANDIVAIYKDILRS